MFFIVDKDKQPFVAYEMQIIIVFYVFIIVYQ
jgi:hypothetical protein